MKYLQSREDLLEHWNEQIRFIKKSCSHYDNGDFSEAKRIATSIRILLHHTRNSNSLVNQLELTENLLLWSSGCLYTPSNLSSSWSLLMMTFDGNSAVYKPLLKDVIGRTFYLQLEDLVE